jgi:hypothetical protein
MPGPAAAQTAPIQTRTVPMPPAKCCDSFLKGCGGRRRSAVKPIERDRRRGGRSRYRTASTDRASRAIDLPQQMVGWHMVFQAEVLEQPLRRRLPPHNRPPPRIPIRENGISRAAASIYSINGYRPKATLTIAGAAWRPAIRSFGYRRPSVGGPARLLFLDRAHVCNWHKADMPKSKRKRA